MPESIESCQTHAGSMPAAGNKQGTSQYLHLLPGMTLVTSAMCAGLAMAMSIGHGTGLVLMLLGLSYALFVTVNKTADY